jgi:hypothetical protein
MVRLLPVICCDQCDERLAEQRSLNDLQPLRSDVRISAYRRLLHLRHAGCDGVTPWRIHEQTATAAGQSGVKKKAG